MGALLCNGSPDILVPTTSYGSASAQTSGDGAQHDRHFLGRDRAID